MIVKAPLNRGAVLAPTSEQLRTRPHYAVGRGLGAWGFSSRVIALLTAVLLSLTWSSAFGDSVKGLEDALGLLSVGKPDPNPIKVQIWTNKEPGESFTTGDRVIVHFQADRDAYLTAVSVSSENGRVSVIFPNKDHPDTKVDKGKLYTLFGDESGLQMKLDGSARKAELAFYVTSKPFALDPLKPVKPATWITFGAGDSENVKILRDKLEAIAGTEGFNRVTLSPKDVKGETLNIKLMGPKKLFKYGKPVQKRLPEDTRSGRPESVTGVQGADEKAPLPDSK